MDTSLNMRSSTITPSAKLNLGMLLEEVREKFGNGIKDCSSTVATPDTEPEYARQDTDENRSKVGTIDTQVDKEIDNLVEQLETMLTPARKLKMGELVILD